jgi:hypothetical protein
MEVFYRTFSGGRRPTDGRHLVIPRYTEPEADVALLLHHLRLVLPQQPPPRLMSAPAAAMPQLKM